MLFIAAGIVMSVIAVFFRGKLKNLSKQVQESLVVGAVKG